MYAITRCIHRHNSKFFIKTRYALKKALPIPILRQPKSDFSYNFIHWKPFMVPHMDPFIVYM